MKKEYIALCIVLLLFCRKVFSQEIFPGGGGTLGSYTMTMPNPSPACVDNLAGCGFTLYNPPGGGSASTITKGPGYTGPFQSHMWWTSALWNARMPDGCPAAGNPPASYYHSLQLRNYHSEDMQPIPQLFITATSQGYILRNRLLALNGGGANNTGNFFADADITIGYGTDTSARTEVNGYGDFHADFQQTISSTAGQTRAGNVLKAKASQGSPFVYFTSTPSGGSTNKEPTFYLFFFRPVAISSSGNSITINRSCCPSGSNQMNWGYTSLFFPPGTTISSDNGATYHPLNYYPLNVESGGNNVYWRIKFPNPNATNYFTTAIMSDPSQAALDDYEQYAFNHITGSSFSYSYNEPAATLTSTFNYTTTNVLGGANNGTLLMLFLHHYLYSPDYPLSATAYTYTSPRGLMRVMRGTQFTTVMQSYGILPGMGWANTANKATLNTFINNYATRPPINIACGNPVYGSFGSIHEAARIALIAHQAGNYTARNTLLTIAKNGIQGWLASPTTDIAGTYVYDNNFNWLTPYPSAFDADRLLQDSHFHHGYLIFAAAIVAKFEPPASTWVAQWGPMINLVIRNINSELRPPATSPGATVPWIPYLRYYDPYRGHSWAGNDGSNQESVSEAINFAAGVAMWGETTGNTSLRDLGLMMYITETEAARMYWWDGPRRGVNNGGACGYAPGYNHWHGAILGTGGVAYATYFGANVSYVHGITYIPITGASIWMGADSLGAANEYADFLAGNGGAEPNGSDGFWHVAMLMEKATFNAAAAKNQFETQAIPGNWSGNDYKVDGYSWITTYDSVGVLDPTVTANTSSFAVFRKNNCKHYMIYNPRGRGARTVTFSDGQSFNVPADTIITYKICTVPLPLSLLDFTGSLQNGKVTLHWKTSFEKNTAYFEIEKSCDGVRFEKIETIQSSGTSNSIQSYIANDFNPCLGKGYYRLKQVDQDKKFSYSKIIMVDDVAPSGFSAIVYPNPLINKATIALMSEVVQRINIRLFDLTGKEIRSGFKTIQDGETTIDLDMTDLPSGNYQLEIQEGIQFKKTYFKLVKIQ